MTAALLDSQIDRSVRLGKTHIADGKLPVPAAIREQFIPDSRIVVELIDAASGRLSLGVFKTRQVRFGLIGVTWPVDMREGDRVEVSVTRGGARRVSVYIDTTPAAPEPVKPVESAVETLSREIVATAQINGGTRVIEMTVTTDPQMGPQYDQVRLTAYDSNHPLAARHMSTYSVAFDGVSRARDDARDLLDFEVRDGLCACWQGWDTTCGHPSCWGVRTA